MPATAADVRPPLPHLAPPQQGAPGRRGGLYGGHSVDTSGSDRAGEIIVKAGHKISKNAAETICTSGVTKCEVIPSPKVPLVFNSLAEDTTSSHEEALLRIYQRLRPGNPPQLEKART